MRHERAKSSQPESPLLLGGGASKASLLFGEGEMASLLFDIKIPEPVYVALVE